MDLGDTADATRVITDVSFIQFPLLSRIKPPKRGPFNSQRSCCVGFGLTCTEELSGDGKHSEAMVRWLQGTSASDVPETAEEGT